MSPNRSKIILIIFFLIIIFIFSSFSCKPGFQKNSNKENQNQQEPEYNVTPEFLAPKDQQTEINTQSTPTENSIVDIDEVEENEIITQLAEKFTERFGTYTSKENFKNIENLKVYMTDSLKAKMEEFVKEKTSGEKSGKKEFFGVATKAVMSKILESNSQSATILVDTKKEEITEKSTKSRVYYQNAVVNLKKINENWMVDDISWSS